MKKEIGMSIDLEVRIAAPVERVWSILSTPEGMRCWQGATVFEPRVGGRVEFRLDARGLPTTDEPVYLMTGEIVRFEPGRALAYTWRQRRVGGEEWPAETLITLTLAAVPGGTLVRVVHSGFENLPGALASEALRDYRNGWEAHDDLGKLKRLAEEGIAAESA